MRPFLPGPAGKRLAFVTSLTFLITACTAPRSVLNSPEALAKGRWQAGMNLDVNIPTETSDKLYGSMEKGLSSLYDRTTRDGSAPITADSLNGYALALI